MISDEYRKMNAQLHASKPGYGTGGARWARMVQDLCESWNTRDVLDYGCGKGRLAEALPFPIAQYDPAIPEHASDPKPCDLVVCTDVLEHIEPDQLSAVLDHLRDLTLKVGLFNVATRRAHKTLPDGRNTHLIVEPIDWWLPMLRERFKSVELVEATVSEFTVLVALPKKFVAMS